MVVAQAVGAAAQQEGQGIRGFDSNHPLQYKG